MILQGIGKRDIEQMRKKKKMRKQVWEMKTREVLIKFVLYFWLLLVNLYRYWIIFSKEKKCSLNCWLTINLND
jgi:hypothetical protein